MSTDDAGAQDEGPLLNGTPVGGRHRYLATARPGFDRTMAAIKNEGGPWDCGSGHASLLVYRCSICGREIGAGRSGHRDGGQR